MHHPRPQKSLVFSPQRISEPFVTEQAVALRTLNHEFNLLWRRRNRGVRRNDQAIRQWLTHPALLPAIVGRPREPQIGENRSEVAIGTELVRTGNGAQDRCLFVGRVTPVGGYRQRPFLSCRFSALSSAMTACRRWTSAKRCSSAGRTFFRPRDCVLNAFNMA